MIDDFDLEEDKEYPEELYPVLELSDSILEFTEKLELIRGKLDDFEQRYLEADEELRECEGYEIPSSSIMERWQNTIEEISDRIELLGDPL
jgi:chromosome segregation ATPase